MKFPISRLWIATLWIAISFSLFAQRAFAQHLVNIAGVPSVTGTVTEKLFRPAPVTEDTLYSLDEARTVKNMDATPDGSHWFVVDEFAHWQYITIDGHPFPTRYHEISATGTRLSPHGDFLIWTGLMHAFTQYSFDSTSADLYRDTSLIVHNVSDYPTLEFGRSGEHWAALLPAAYFKQTTDRDLIIVDGKLVRKGEPYPHQFSFSHDEQHWAYRSTNGLLEKLVTDRSDSAILLYKWPTPSATSSYDATVWRYTPDITIDHKFFEGRDYDYGFDHVAKVNKTAYSSLSADTARVYVNFNGHNGGLYRWASSFLIDDSGHHIAYAACDPTVTKKSRNERRAVVVYDGKVFAGPFPGLTVLFMSPSGKHIAYSLDLSSSKFYLDKKVLVKTSAVIEAVWSPDETKLAFIAAGEHGKYFVVADGKRSPLFERIGRLGWSADGRTVEFVGLINSKVIEVKQPL